MQFLMDNLLIACKLLLAVVLGGLVGWEREVNERPAGLRTHVLVSLGAALVTVISLSFNGPGMDPSRIAAQIVSGMGFLGAGAILRQGSIVRGLTTAASLWVVAAIGMAAGIGGNYAVIAIFTTLLVFATLSLVNRFEYMLGTKAVRELSFEISSSDSHVLAGILGKLMASGIRIRSMETSEKENNGAMLVHLILSSSSKITEKAVSDLLSAERGAVELQWH
jgi:putative Mg2+ transporter-C (MgtC) family protein